MQKTLIWDIPTRLFHWLIVASLLAQYATVEWLENKVQWHFYIGYFTLFLIVFRIIWGFVGTQHAKFSSFITGPRKVFNYIKTLFKWQSEPAIGHNPLGGWFVVVMLVLLTIQAVSGLFMTDDIFLDGPYRQLAGEVGEVAFHAYRRRQLIDRALLRKEGVLPWAATPTSAKKSFLPKPPSYD